MIQTSTNLAPAAAEITHAGRLWGLGANELHEAYWRSCGVQCIRRGQQTRLQPGVDLFLLIEPDQLVWFDLHAMAERLAWRAAAITRVRVIGQDDEAYGEYVVVDEAHFVQRITRRYRPQTHAAYRVLLTRKSRLAKIWMAGSDRRTCWRRIRKLAGESHIDAWRTQGRCFSLEDAADDMRYIDHLVEVWESPDRAVDGIIQVHEGVWAHADDYCDEDSLVIGPAFLGFGSCKSHSLCLVGPTWLADHEAIAEGMRVRVRDIIEIEPGQSSDETHQPAPARGMYGAAKRALDILVSGIGLLFMLPLLMLIGVLIWIEDGWPMLYRQPRQGKGGRIFNCWKFRTMCHDADAMKSELSKDNVCDGPQFYLRDDPRVTRIGRILRRSYLDELPQLWNVFIGDMSLVGPRPSPDNENQICPAWRELRLSVRPGLTGLWQLERTREPGTDFQEWIRYDLEYLDRASFWFDVQLLWRTWLAMIKR